MSQYSEVLDRICNDWLNRPDLRAEAARAVKSAIRAVEHHRFWFNETATALTTSAGQTFVVPPTNMLSFDRLEITENSADYELVQRPFFEVREIRASRPAGKPSLFTYYADQFELAVIPDSVYSLPLYYLKQLPALSADTDTNAWTTFGENLIAHSAARDMFAGVLRVAPQDIAYHAQAAAAGRTELFTANATRTRQRLRATRL